MRGSLTSIPHITSCILQGKTCLRKAAIEGNTLFCKFSYFLSAGKFALILGHLRQAAYCRHLFHRVSRKESVKQQGTEGVYFKNVCKKLNKIKCGLFSMTLCVAASLETCKAQKADSDFGSYKMKKKN